MVNQILTAFFIFLTLFFGTFLCGYLPSLIKAPPNVMNKIAIFGGGSIAGAALIIVLPESASIIINAQNKLDLLAGERTVDETFEVPESTLYTIGTAMIVGFSSMLLIDQVFRIYKEKRDLRYESAPMDVYHNLGDRPREELLNSQITTPGASILGTTKERRQARRQAAALVTTIALCMHSLAEGVAMGSSLFCKCDHQSMCAPLQNLLLHVNVLMQWANRQPWRRKRERLPLLAS